MIPKITQKTLDICRLAMFRGTFVSKRGKSERSRRRLHLLDPRYGMVGTFVSIARTTITNSILRPPGRVSVNNNFCPSQEYNVALLS